MVNSQNSPKRSLSAHDLHVLLMWSHHQLDVYHYHWVREKVLNAFCSSLDQSYMFTYLDNTIHSIPGFWHSMAASQSKRIAYKFQRRKKKNIFMLNGYQVASLLRIKTSWVWRKEHSNERWICACWVIVLYSRLARLLMGKLRRV